MKRMYRMGKGVVIASEPDPRRVHLPEKDCERLTRPEYEALESLLVLSLIFQRVKGNLKKRAECIPYGKFRLEGAYGCIDALLGDIVGTITHEQARSLWNTLADKDVRFVPRTVPAGKDVLVDLETMQDLIRSAKEKCVGCVEDDESCRECRLYKVLEVICPLDDYSNGMLCPYYRTELEEQ